MMLTGVCTIGSGGQADFTPHAVQVGLDLDVSTPPSSGRESGLSRGSQKLKRTLFPTSSTSDNEQENLWSDGGSPVTPRTPRSSRSTPLSERQQLALIMQMMASSSSPPAEEVQKSSPVVVNRRQSPKEWQRFRKLYKRNERGETPLHVAAIKGDAVQIQRCVRLGIDVNCTDFAGWTALHEACNHGWKRCAEVLLKSGASVNSSGLDNDTPLHDAAVNGHRELVELLLLNGADPRLRNARGRTPLDVANTNEIRTLILSNLGSASSSLDNSSIPHTPVNPFPNTPTSTRSTTSAQNEQQHTPQVPQPEVTVTGGGLDISPTEHKPAFYHCNMRKTSPQRQTPKGSEKASSPRLTLRFQPIKSRDEPTSKSQEVSATEPRYQSYCVTMETHDVYAFSKEEEEVSSTKPYPPEYPDSADMHVVTSSRETVTDDSSNKNRLAENNAYPSVQIERHKVTSECANKTTSDNGEGKLGKISEGSNHVRPELGNSEHSDSELEEIRCKKRKDLCDSKLPQAGGNGSIVNRNSNSSNSSGFNSSKEKNVVSTHREEGKSPVNTSVVSSLQSSKGVRSSSSSDGESTQSDCEGGSSENHKQKDITNSASSSVSSSPKVPPLKIVIPTSAALEQDKDRTKANTNRQALPYIVNSSQDSVVDSKSDSFINTVETTTYSVKDENNKISKDYVPGSNEEKTHRVTRSSHRIAAAHATTSDSHEEYVADKASTTTTTKPMDVTVEEDPLLDVVHPRKRKIKSRDISNDLSSQPSTSSGASTSSSVHSEDQPVINCYEMYLNIRKQVDRRRKGMCVVPPKPPQGFKDYLMNRCSYVLAGNAASRLSVPMISPPQSLTGNTKDLFECQEKERYNLRLQHIIEKEKLVLTVEQEILRVHGRAARALANQTVPLSVCTILKDEEIYNQIEPDQEEKERIASRTRYNGRLFLSWLQDVDDKWQKIKEAMLLRHHNEAESLHAVQKLEWEWKLRELGLCDGKTAPSIDELHVPMVHVSDEFDLLPA